MRWTKCNIYKLGSMAKNVRTYKKSIDSHSAYWLLASMPKSGNTNLKYWIRDRAGSGTEGKTGDKLNKQIKRARN